MSILKPGEIKAIQENFEFVKVNGKLKCRMHNNSIVLASSKEKRITLRTNGLVVYGKFYDNSGEVIKFTHDYLHYEEPYVATEYYSEYKKVILNAWRSVYDDRAKAKLKEVQAIIGELKRNAQEVNTVNTNNNTEKEETKEMTVHNTIETKTINKEVNIEVTSDMSVMAIAHLIRRELKLEGHYHVQMKIAMSYAWQVKKGEETLESLNIKATDVKPEAKTIDTSVKTTNTYNAEEDFSKIEKYFVDRATKICSDNDIFPTDAGFIIMETKNMVVKAIEQQDTTNMSARDLTIAIRKDIFNKISQLVTEQVELDAIAAAKEKAAQDLATEGQVRSEVQQPVVSYRLELISFVNGIATVGLTSDNKLIKTCGKLKANNLEDFDQKFANTFLKNAIASLNNTTIVYYGMYTQAMFENSEELQALAKSKNISLVLGSAPSGIVA